MKLRARLARLNGLQQCVRVGLKLRFSVGNCRIDFRTRGLRHMLTHQTPQRSLRTPENHSTIVVVGYCLVPPHKLFSKLPIRSALLCHLKDGRTELTIKITGVGNEEDIARMDE